MSAAVVTRRRDKDQDPMLVGRPSIYLRWVQMIEICFTRRSKSRGSLEVQIRNAYREDYVGNILAATEPAIIASYMAFSPRKLRCRRRFRPRR